MRSAPVLFLIAGSMLLAGCQMAPSTTPRAQLGNEGLVYVYLQPLSPKLNRLQLRLASAAAVTIGGSAAPLDLRFNELSVSRVGRERLLAVGTLPPGSYRGLTVGIVDARLAGQTGEAALLVPERPVEVAVPFTVGARRAVVVSLRLNETEAVIDGHRLQANFSAQIPEQLTTGLIGLASSRAWNTVTVFDKQNGRVHAVVPTGRRASGIALDRVRLRAYVASAGDDTILTIDLLSGRVIDRLQMQIGDRPTELVLTGNGQTLLTANAGSNSVSFLDARALFETDRLIVGNGPGSILLNPEQTRAYVFNRLNDTVSLVDLAIRRVILTAATDAGPIRGAFDRRGATLYVIHGSSPYLTLFNPDLTIRTRVFVGPSATALTVDPRTDRVYLARRATGSVDVYDPSSLLPIDSIPTDSDVAFLSIDGELNNLAMLMIQAEGVRLVNLTNRDPVAEIDIGVDGYWVAFVGEG